MALTLLEAAKLMQGDAVRSSVIETFARSSDLLQVLPFNDIAGNAYKYNQESAMPGVAFRGVNEAYTEDVGVLNPVTEPLVIAGGDLDVDKFIVDTEGPGQRELHEDMKIKHLAQLISYKFIKGDADSDPKEFYGMQSRLTGNQLITQSAGAATLAKLDELIDAVDEPTHLFMNKAMRRRLTAAARLTTVGGYITYDVDAFGRQVTKYNDLPILISDANDQNYAATDFTEASSTTSIYCLSLGEGRLGGIQNGMMDVRDLGEQDAKPVYRTRVEWYVGLVLYHPRAAARYENITNVAVTA